MALCVAASTSFSARAAQASHQFLTARRREFSASVDTEVKKVVESVSRSNDFRAFYESKLASHPLMTKSATGLVLWGLGDAVAQGIPRFLIKEGCEPEPYDFPRSARAMIFGCAVHAPIAHVHFNFLEWLTVKVKPPGVLGPTIFKTVVEQFVYWSWLSNALYHGCMGAMQGMPMTDVKTRLEETMWPTMKAQWLFWIPVQLINFRFTPVCHQLNVVLATSVVWTAFLSLAFPPSEKAAVTEEVKS